MPPDWEFIKRSKIDWSKTHTIERVDGDHYIIDSDIHILWEECFAGSGWIIKKDGEKINHFQNPKDRLQEVLDKVLGGEYKPKLMTPPVGD